MPTGTVKWYNPEKGFGFIERDGGGDDLFVHRSAVGWQTLGEGDRVEFTEGHGPKGPSAETITVIQTNPNPRPARGGGGGRSFESSVDVSSLPVESGTVDRFDETRGFGFIKPDNGGADIFVHISAVQASGLSGLTENQKVSFDTEPDRRGKGPKAVNLQISG